MNIYNKLSTINIPKDEFVCIGGTVMALLELRPTQDVDIVVSPHRMGLLLNQGWELKSFEGGRTAAVKDIFEAASDWVGHTFIQIQERSITIDGYPCINLAMLIDCKLRIGRPKDLEDVKLIRHYLNR